MIANQPQSVQELNKRKSTWMDTAQLVVSILVLIVFLGLSILSFVGIVASGTNRELSQILPTLWVMGFAFLFLAGIALVSAISSRQVYYEISQPRKHKKDTKWLYWSIALLPLLIMGGCLVLNAWHAPDFLLPLITILSLSVAMIWILKLGLRDYWGENPKRDSGLFSFSMSFSTFYIMLVQVLLLIIAITMVLSSMSKTVDLEFMLEKFSMNPEQQAEELMSNPKFALFMVLAIAVVGPIIEELFKTIGVWLLKPRNISPREGWFAGIMSGAGFGLIEGYLFGMQGILMPDISGWVYFVLGRIGGLLLHTFTGGIVGWGLAKSWREKRPQHAIWSYLIVFLMHGLWNFVAVAQPLLSSLYSIELPDIAVYISLGILFMGMLVAYLSLSYKITREMPAENTLPASYYLPQNPDGADNSAWRA